ncbi:hypothetical protein BC830DRAFT_739179 [Chytriomyces sp. MP71]|nr:hypothetical protein BC830DRAFT_739179 [Chytriomyces sp. MP71]
MTKTSLLLLKKTTKTRSGQPASPTLRATHSADSRARSLRLVPRRSGCATLRHGLARFRVVRGRPGLGRVSSVGCSYFPEKETEMRGTLTILLMVLAVLTTLSHAAQAENSLYDLLGVSPTASTRDVRRAFLKLAKKYMKNVGYMSRDEERAILKEAKEAADAGRILSDEKTRLIYDAYQENAFCWTPFWECTAVNDK